MNNPGTDFIISLFRFFVYVVSIIILIPLIKNHNNSVFISILVYAMGKLIDYIERALNFRRIHFFILRLVNIFFIASLIVVCLLYYSDNYVTESKGVYFVIALLLAIVTCVVDSIEVAYQIIKLYRTQKNIIEANVES